MKMMKNGLISLIAVLLFSGCGLVSPRDDVSPAEIGRDIHIITRGVVSTAILQGDDVDKQIGVATILVTNIDRFAMPLLTDLDNPINHDAVNSIFELVPLEYRGLMSVAYALFNNHFTFPDTQEHLQEPQLTYLRAFVSGLRDGAQDVLDSHGVVMTITVKVETGVR